MTNYNKTLIEFCNNNNFTDSETESSDEESSKIILKQPKNNSENNMDGVCGNSNGDIASMKHTHGTQIKNNFYDKEPKIILKQNKNNELTDDKITIIIDSNHDEPSIIDHNLYCEKEWETIELSDLDDMILDISNHIVTKQKQS